MNYRKFRYISAAASVLIAAASCGTKEQQASKPDFEAETTEISIPISGFTEDAPGVFEFTASSDWTATYINGGNSWFTFSPSKGSAGKSKITYTALDNEGGRTRKATLTIVTGVTVRDVNFTQRSIREGELGIEWEEPVKIASNPAVYGRVRRLDDGRLMACYSTGTDAYIKFSSNDGASWSGAKCIYENYVIDENIAKIDNPDFAQLSSTNPYKPGRIIYAVNERVKKEDDKDAFPFYITVLTSDDGGASWSSPLQIYSSSAYAGCYEPFVLELPDGTVQVYFADESPYASESGIGDQNVSVIESKDGGETWGEARVASYAKNGRDGMPSATIYNGNIYLAIEYRKPSGGEDFHPVVVYNSVSDNWVSPVGDFADGTPRFDPFQTSLQPEKYYNGAPYITQTDNYWVLSYQTNRAPSGTAARNSDLEIQLCPKSEMDGAVFSKMRSASRPAGIDMTKKYANWNSVNCIGGDTVMAVYCSDGCVYGVKGTVVE